MKGYGASELNLENINTDVLKLIKTFAADIDFGYSGEIGPGCRILEDLDLDSIKVVMLFSEIQKQFGRGKIPFEDLIWRENGLDDFTIRELVEFLYAHLNGATPG